MDNKLLILIKIIIIIFLILLLGMFFNSSVKRKLKLNYQTDFIISSKENKKLIQSFEYENCSKTINMYFHENVASLDLSNDSLKLTIKSFQIDYDNSLVLNNSQILSFIKFFRPCFKNKNKRFCSIIQSKPVLTGNAVHSILCKNVHRIENVLNVCFDLNDNLNSAFGGRFIFYPEFLSRLYFLINQFINL